MTSVSDTSGTLAGCSDCAGPTSGLDDEVCARLDELCLTGCVIRAETTGDNPIGESPYGIVYEVSLNFSLRKSRSLLHGLCSLKPSAPFNTIIVRPR